MDLAKCPYCNTESSLDNIEKEGGSCPECGALISGSSLFDTIPTYSDDDYDDEDEEEDDDDDIKKEALEFEDFEEIDLESDEEGETHPSFPELLVKEAVIPCLTFPIVAVTQEWWFVSPSPASRSHAGLRNSSHVDGRICPWRPTLAVLGTSTPTQRSRWIPSC